MESKDIERIEELKSKIAKLDRERAEYECEIDKIYVATSHDFEGEYVEFYNGDNYIYMRVEKQLVSNYGFALNLEGPAVEFDSNPLEDTESITWGTYNDVEGLYVSASLLKGTSNQTIRKITKDEMIKALDIYFSTIKDKLIQNG